MSSPDDAVAGGAFDPAPCARGCLLHLGRGRDPPNPRVPVHLPRSPHLWTDRTARGPFRRRTPAHGETEPGRLAAPPTRAPVGAPIGVNIAKFCPACGMQNERRMNFCTDCCTRLTDPAIFGTKG